MEQVTSVKPLEADTMFERSEKLKIMLPKLPVANGRSSERVEFEVLVNQFVDRYPPDNGPLTERQIAAVRADVQKNFPRGKLISRKELFK